jgi:hypothetical protein
MARSSENKTQPTTVPVAQFIAGVEHPQRRADAMVLLELMERITGEPAVMWGPSIIGFGQYHYKYASGREGDMAAAGFSPRKAEQVIYLYVEDESQDGLLDRLGPHRFGKCCLYIKRLADVDMKVLEQLIHNSYSYVMARKTDMHKV